MLVWLARKSNNIFELEEMLTNYKCTRDIQMEISRTVVVECISSVELDVHKYKANNNFDYFDKCDIKFCER